MQAHHQAMRPDAREFLDDNPVVEEVHSATAEFFGSIGTKKAGRAHFAPALAIAHSGAVPVGDLRYELVLGKAAHLRPKQVMFFGKNVAAHRTLLMLSRQYLHDM